MKIRFFTCQGWTNFNSKNEDPLQCDKTDIARERKVVMTRGFHHSTQNKNRGTICMNIGMRGNNSYWARDNWIHEQVFRYTTFCMQPRLFPAIATLTLNTWRSNTHQVKAYLVVFEMSAGRPFLVAYGAHQKTLANVIRKTLAKSVIFQSYPAAKGLSGMTLSSNYHFDGHISLHWPPNEPKNAFLNFWNIIY